MDCLNHREGCRVICQVFLLSPLQCTLYSKFTVDIHKRLHEFEKKICKRLREFEEI
jgi:hypothetical protein